jgi:hypothetical protein
MPITKITVKDLGDVFLRLPINAWVHIDISEIMRTTPPGERLNAKITAALIANCYVDEQGKRIYENYEDMLDRMDSTHYGNLKSAAEAYIAAAMAEKPEDPEKNSETVPSSSQPSSSLAS